MLERLLSKEVVDVSIQLPQSMEEMKKIIEQKDKEIQALRKENQEKDTQNEQQRKEIEELKQALLLASSRK